MKFKNAVITETDFDRLNGLVHSRLGRLSYGSLATALDDDLRRGEVVSATQIPREVVTMNSTVLIRETGSKQRETFTLVFPQDADVTEGRLSVLAPLGRALLGARVGDVVAVNAPAGMRRIKIEHILYQPEAAGDYHL